MKVYFKFEADTTLSGQRSSTQKHIGILLIFFMKIAGKPTVIGEGSKTKIKSYLYFIRKSALQIPPKMNDKKFNDNHKLEPVPRGITGALYILIFLNSQET